MNGLKLGTALLGAALLIATRHGTAADANSPLAKDLTATLSLLGLPCGQVVNVTTQGNNDHLATCSNGSRYRIYVNAQGQVAAEKR